MTVPKALKGYTHYEDYAAIGSPPFGVNPFTLDADGKAERSTTVNSTVASHWQTVSSARPTPSFSVLDTSQRCQSSFLERDALCNHIQRTHRLSISPSANGTARPSAAFVIQEKTWYSSIMNIHRQMAAQGVQQQQQHQQQLASRPAPSSSAAAESIHGKNNPDVPMEHG